MAVAKSSIEWTDSTWSPVTGCTKVSPGCDHCYAETFAERWRGTPGHPYERGFDVQLRPERLDQPLRWKRPRRIFVNSMSDLFHDAVPDEYIAKVWAVMALAPNHTFQILTKRHGRMRSLLTSGHFVAKVWGEVDKRAPGVGAQAVSMWPSMPLPNVWLGVSVEDQKRADLRIPALLDTPAAVRWISAEPLLGPVELHRHLFPGRCGSGCSCRLPDDADGRDCGCDGPCTGADWRPDPGLHWVVTGGESGPGARPAHPDWFRDIRDQCDDAGVPYLHKQNGEWAPVGPLYGDSDEVDDAHMEAVHLEVSENRRVVQLERSGHVVDGYQPTDPRTWLMARVGKKRAGRELDGRDWNEYPAVAP